MLLLAASPLASAAPKGSPVADPLEAPRRDPNDAPYMKPRNGGARPDGTRVYKAEHSPLYGHRKRFRFTLKPLYASLRAAMLGRSDSPLNPKRGLGAGLDADVPVWRPIWLRVTASYSGHLLPQEFSRDEDEAFVLTAPRGTLHIGHVAAALLYTMDRGRMKPILEVGLGPLWARGPQGVLDGQRGQPCLSDNRCDFGLSCDPSDSVCRPSTTFVVHGGLGLDVEVTKRTTVGAGLRYFAFLSNPQAYPVYLQAALRFGLRF